MEKRQVDQILDMMVSREDITNYEIAETLNDNVFDSHHWQQELYDLATGKIDTSGYHPPWNKMQGLFAIRPSELTVMTAENGAGKTLVAYFIALYLLACRAKVCIASLELYPRQTIERMIHQLYDTPLGSTPTTQQVDGFFRFAEENLSIYSEVGDMYPERAIALCKSVAAKGVEVVIVDSLMKLGTLADDYASEKKLISSLQNVAKQTKLHIILVAHNRKNASANDKYATAGSAHITNMADNVIVVWRNREKEREVDKINAIASVQGNKPVIPDDVSIQADTFIRVDKQRHGTGTERTWGFVFTRGGQFVDRANESYDLIAKKRVLGKHEDPRQ